MARKKYITVNDVNEPGTVAHTANDVVGGLYQWDISPNGGGISGGRIKGLAVHSGTAAEANAAALVLWLFDATPTTFAGNAAYAPTHADFDKLIGTVDIPAGQYGSVNTTQAAYIDGLEIAYAGDRVFGYFVCSGTPTFGAAEELTARLTVETEA